MSDVASSSLVRLHRIHRQLADLRERLARGPRQIEAGQANVRRLEQTVEDAKAALQKARVNADQRQLQLNEREQRIGELQAKLNTAASNREYQALKEQIAADAQANSVLTDEIIELLDRIEDLEKRVGQSREALTQGQAELDQLRGRVREELGKLESEVERVSAELQEAEAELPADFRPEYQRLARARGEDALAQVEDMTCQGCYTTITTPMYSDLLSNKPVFCKSCGRMLYLPEDRRP